MTRTLNACAAQKIFNLSLEDVQMAAQQLGYNLPKIEAFHPSAFILRDRKLQLVCTLDKLRISKTRLFITIEGGKFDNTADDYNRVLEQQKDKPIDTEIRFTEMSCEHIEYETLEKLSFSVHICKRAAAFDPELLFLYSEAHFGNSKEKWKRQLGDPKSTFKFVGLEFHFENEKPRLEAYYLPIKQISKLKWKTFNKFQPLMYFSVDCSIGTLCGYHLNYRGV